MSDKIEGLDPQYAARLYKMLDRYFNEQELRSLMFGLGVDYDSLAGAGKSDKARELIGYMFRRGSLEKLLLGVNRERPNVPWPYPPINEPFAEPSQSTIPPSRYNTPAAMPSRSPQQPMGQPVRTAPTAAPAPATTATGADSGRNPLVYVGIVVGLLVLIAGGYLIYQAIIGGDEEPDFTETTPPTAEVTETDFDGEGSNLDDPPAPNSNEPVDGGTGTTTLPPSGKLLAFVRGFGTENMEIFITQEDGSNANQLTNSDGQNWGPSWSPDGSRIAFASDRDNNNNELYVMDADGSNQTRLTNTSSMELFPSWSPDGRSLVYYRFETNDENRDIFTLDTVTGQVRQLTTHPKNDTYPAWSPDGSLLAFHSNRDGNYEIYTMRPDGSNPTRITVNGADDYSPAWSGDGSQIVFHTTRDGEREIYTMEANGNNQTRITFNAQDDRWAAWQP